MAVFSKKGDRLTHPIYKSVKVESSELSSEDIVDLVESLGKHARVIKIVTSGGSNLSIRTNVRNIHYRPRLHDQWSNPLTGPHVNLTEKVESIDNTQPSEDLTSSEPTTWELHDGPFKDIELTWTTGTWTLIAS
jgi:hypothetical protein